VAFRSGARVGSLDELARAHDAVLATCGEGESLGLRKGPRGIAVHADTLQTDLPNVFAGGGAIGRSRKLAVWAVADGRHLAHSCDQFLRGAPVTGLPRPFHSVIGKLREGELEVFLQQADARGRVEPAAGLAGGYTAGEAAAECARCMHCDCRKREHCDLRDRATELEAHGPRYRIHGRAKVTLERRHASVVFEPGKCIKCGLCLEVARRHGEPLGLAFVGRGFEVRVAVPFDEPLSAGLKAAAADCVQICPTGALAFSGE
jgi:ferredoxin